MDATAQRIAIAEACGWTDIREQDYCESHVNPYDGQVLQFWQGVSPDGEKSEIPDYLNDLNAIRSAVMETQGLCHADYLANLWNILGLQRTSVFWDTDNFKSLMVVANAPAEKCAEAFLKTIGKWTITPPTT